MAETASTSVPATAHRNPFPGLRPFRADEEHLFFGRENQVDRMVDKLAVRRFLAVVGTSGSGKSSLVNCGLRPALHRGYMAKAGSAWRMAQFRTGDNPIGAMARALAQPGVLFEPGAQASMAGRELEQLVEATLRLGSLGLVDMVEQARLAPGENLLLVVDQFEELFRFRGLAQKSAGHVYGPAEDSIAFVRMLLEAAAQHDLPIFVVLTMRSDFLGECAQFHGLPEAINEGQYLVPRLTRDEIRAAITGPVSVAQATISPVLITRLLNDVGDNPDQLSILQHALNRTWANWESEGGAKGDIDLAHYEAIGGMQHALDLHAEKAYGELAEARQQRICERVFKALTDKGTDPRGIRRPTRLASLCAIIDARQDEVTAVIDTFRKPSRSFLMPPLGETLTPESVIDISHESLMRVWERLARWADEEAVSARVYRRVVETATLHDAKQASLWRDPDLRRALDWRRQNEPTAAWAAQYQGDFTSAIGFLDRSRDVQIAEKLEDEIERRWRYGWNLVPVVLAAAAFFALQSSSLVQAFAHEVFQYFVSLQFLKERSGEIRQSESLIRQLLTGIPAALAYMVLAPYCKRVFHRITLRSFKRHEGADRTLVEDLETASEAKVVDAIEAHATVYAGFWRRALAHVTDWACLLLASAVAIVCAGIFMAIFDIGSGNDADDFLGLMFLNLMVVVAWFYHALSLSSARQSTPGMRVAGIFVTDLHGRRLSFGRATLRHFASFVSYYVAGLGYLMQPFNARRQTLHDRLSSSVVLCRPAKR
jgi:uncharacterized RDD family membrane protein YckC